MPTSKLYSQGQQVLYNPDLTQILALISELQELIGAGGGGSGESIQDQIDKKVNLTTFDSALANTNSYIATKANQTDLNTKMSVANTNSALALKASLSGAIFTGDISIERSNPVIYFKDTDTDGYGTISFDQAAGNLFLSADNGNTLASSGIYLNVDGAVQGSIRNNGMILGSPTGTYKGNGSINANTVYENGSRITTLFRERLTANRTYYVRTDGSDSNTGLINNSGGAFLTIQKAVNVALTLDFSIYNVTIQVGDGTYTGAVTIGSHVGSGILTIQGNSTTPSNVLVHTTSSNAFLIENGAYVTISNMQIRTTTNGWCIYARLGSTVTINNLDFGESATGHMAATQSTIVTTTNYKISGSCAYHIYAEDQAYIKLANITVTITGTPTFTIFAVCNNTSILILYSNTYSGSANGQRYSAIFNSVISVNGGGATYLPGSTSGSTTTGSQYA